MELLVGCVCGMDPGSESFVVHSAIAAAITTPWYFRNRVLGALRRVRRLLPGDPARTAGCPPPDDLPQVG